MRYTSSSLFLSLFIFLLFFNPVCIQTRVRTNYGYIQRVLNRQKIGCVGIPKKIVLANEIAGFGDLKKKFLNYFE
jgi:hypothetical protein